MSQRKIAVTQGIWGVANVALIRAVTFVAQIVLAIMLSPTDFGIYAVAMAVATLALTLRGAGVTQWQIEGGARQHKERAVDAFWLALVWNVALGLTVAAASQPLGRLFGEHSVGVLIAIIGLSFPLQTPATYFFARLQIQLRIRELTFVELASAVVRNVLMISGAAIGLGPYSFVLPIPLCYLLEAALGWWLVRESPWRHAPHRDRWPTILRSTSWIMLGTAGTAIGLQGDYVLLGAFAPIAAVGIYYFAYQLTLQTAGLVATNINRIFTSVLVANEPAIRARNFLAATEFIMLAGSPVVLLLAAGIVPFEALVWNGKWAEATNAVLYLSLGLPLYLLATATQSLALSEGRFRRWMAMNATKAFVVVGAAALVGWYGGGSDAISACMAIGLAAAHLIQVWIAVRGTEISIRSVWSASWTGAVMAPILLVVCQQALTATTWPALVELFAGPGLLLALYAVLAGVARPRLFRAGVLWLRGRAARA
jgi:PST family polysaccharide transporter